MKALGKDPVINARAVLRDAMLDPELAKLILSRDALATQQALEGRLRTYVTNNIAAELATEDKPRPRVQRSTPSLGDVSQTPPDEIFREELRRRAGNTLGLAGSIPELGPAAAATRQVGRPQSTSS